MCFPRIVFSQPLSLRRLSWLVNFCAPVTILPAIFLAAQIGEHSNVKNSPKTSIWQKLKCLSWELFDWCFQLDINSWMALKVYWCPSFWHGGDILGVFVQTAWHIGRNLVCSPSTVDIASHRREKQVNAKKETWIWCIKFWKQVKNFRHTHWPDWGGWRCRGRKGRWPTTSTGWTSCPPLWGEPPVSGQSN